MTADRGEHRLAAVVPAWDEATAIGGVVRGLRAVGACCVFVVDPGSTDSTRTVAREAGAVVVDEPRRGYGRACLSGAEAAAGHGLIAFLDGDGSCDPADLPALEAAAAEADLVLGRRLSARAQSLPAALGNRLVAAVMRRRTGREVHDLPPLKLVRADVLGALALDEAGYGWTVQLVGRALSHPALRVVEVPAAFLPRAGGRSKVSGRLLPSVRAGLVMLTQALAATRRRGLLVLMAKGPGSADSKTRLAAELGAAVTAGFWSACLADSAQRLASVGLSARLDVVAMTPSPAEAASVRDLTGLPCLVQTRPGLRRALYEVFERGAPFTIAVSADTPSLPRERLLEAVAALRSAEAVIGPGDDGGYYLVGLRRNVPRWRRRKAFLEAPMGSDRAREWTREALGGAAELPAWPDVDTAADLGRLALTLRTDADAAPNVARWLAGREDREEAG
jgi:glycosyltransferase A (GT-A) superfamily protein (DUF2064 family)